MALYGPSKFVHIASATTTVVHAGNCILERLVINTTAAGAITIYNDDDGTDNTIAILPSSAAVGTYEYGCYCSLGVSVVTAAASDITVIVRPMG